MNAAASTSAAGAPFLAFSGFSAGYLDEPIVRDFSATIDAGSITTIIGGNGAGKSTLLKAVYGMNKHFGGSLHFKGRAVEKLSPRERLQAGIGFVPQGRCNFPRMTVRENLELGCFTLGKAAARAAFDAALATFPLLTRKLDVLAGNMSGGEQQFLETAMVLEAGPTLLLLDEPSLGLSPASQDQIFRMMTELRDRGVTVLVVEQNAHGALEVSDTGIVMELGRLFMSGPAAGILRDPRVRTAFLGE